MLSSKNKMISCKVSKDIYEYIKTFSDKYGVSVSVFVQDSITQNILNIDKECRSLNYSSPDIFYKKYSAFLNSSYDERKKKVRF